MLDKEILGCIISGNKKFITTVSEPFNNLAVDFLGDFSDFEMFDFFQIFFFEKKI